MKVFELVGMPGAGKSTICRALAVSDGRIHLPTSRLIARLSSGRKLQMVCSPLFSARVFISLFVYGLWRSGFSPRLVRWSLRTTALATAIKVSKRYAGSHDVILLDEGFIQTAASAAVPSRRRSGSGALLEHLFQNGVVDGVIYAQCSVSLSRSRLAVRGTRHSRFDPALGIMGPSDFDDYLRELEAGVGRAGRSLPVISVDASQSIDRSVEAIESFLAMSGAQYVPNSRGASK